MRPSAAIPRRYFTRLDLLERLMPITNGRLDAFMDFCTELEELPCGAFSSTRRLPPGIRKAVSDLLICIWG